MNTEPPFTPEQAAALRKLRRRWFVALLVNAALPFVALPITGSEWLEHAPPEDARHAMLVAALLGVASVIGGLYARNQAYKAHWRGDVVEPAGYLAGNTRLFVGIGGGAAAMFLISTLTAYPAPTFAAAPILIGLLAMNLPNGRPMRPTPPRIGTDGEGL